MQDNDIHTRGQLAPRLERRGISRNAIYRQFAEDWSGEATVAVMAALAREFRVALTQLVIEPFEAR